MSKSRGPEREWQGARDSRSAEGHRKIGPSLLPSAQAGPQCKCWSAQCPSRSLPSWDDAQAHVEAHSPQGPQLVGLGASCSTPPPPRDLSPHSFPSPCRTFSLEQKTKKQKNHHHHEWITNTAGEYTASVSGEKQPPPPLPSPRRESVMYTFHRPCAPHKGENEIPLPCTDVVLSSVLAQGTGTDQRGRKDRARCLWGAGAMSLQINLLVASARTVRGGGEKSIGARETHQRGAESDVQVCPPSRPQRSPRTLGCWPASPSSGPLARISLSQLSLFLPESDSPVTVLV